MSVQRCQCEIPSSEYMDWIAYLDEDINKFHREDYYLANIATEIRRSYVADPMKVKIESFLMKFEQKEEVERPKMSIEERTKRSKGFWSMLVSTPKGRK